MYENDDYRIQINWKNLLLKLALIVLLVLLIIWIFPTPKLDSIYSRIYNENLNTMKSVAENYFTYDKLPKETGATNTLKLQDMVDKKIITSFTDKDNNACNGTNSYAQVTKTDNNNYVLKVQLSCNEKTDYILENLDVKEATNSTSKETTTTNNNTTTTTTTTESKSDKEDILKDGNSDYDKDIAVTQYQYKRAVTKTHTTYKCPDGYIKEGNTCYKYNTGETIPATPLYFDDVEVITDAKKNETGEYTVTVEPNKELVKSEKVCPEGYTLSGDVCYTYKSATVVPGTTKYECEKGELKDDKCIITVEPAKKIVEDGYYTCDNGGTLNGTKCTKTTTSTYGATYHAGQESCSCPSGYYDNGSNCARQVTKTSSYAATESSYWSNPNVVTSSSPMTSYNNGTSKRECLAPVCNARGCTYTCYEYTLIKKYDCPNGGSLSGTSCIITTTSTEYANKNCSSSEGYYSCDNGGELRGSTCYVTNTTTYNATYHKKNDVIYICPTGYVETGKGENTKCVKTVDAKKVTTETEYKCEDGYVKKGTTCYKYTEPSIKNTYKYTCPSDYEQSGKDENTKCSKTIKSEVTYYCENADEVLIDDKCKKIIKGALKGYECPSGYILNNKECVLKTLECGELEAVEETYTTYEYKWSTETSLEGWTRTGKTKTTESTNEYEK